MSLDLASRLTLPGHNFQFPDLIVLFDAATWRDATPPNACVGSLPRLGSSSAVQPPVRSAGRVLRAGCAARLKVTLLRLLRSASHRSQRAVCEEQGDHHIQKPALPDKMEM